MRGETFGVIVAAILAVAIITVAIIFNTSIAKHASYHLARQACKVSAFLRYATDVRARVAEKIFPLPIFVTSHECNIDIQLEKNWIEILARRLKYRSEEEGGDYKYILGNISLILQGCEKILERGDNEELKTSCLKLLSYFTIAYLIKDTWETFSDLNANITVFCISFPKEILPFTIDENSVNIAINLLYSKEELAAKRDYCSEPFENKKVGNIDNRNGDSIINIISDICLECKHNFHDNCIIDGIEIGTAACDVYNKVDSLKNLRKIAIVTSDGGYDKIYFPNNGIIEITHENNKICIAWAGKPFAKVGDKELRAICGTKGANAVRLMGGTSTEIRNGGSGAEAR